jgi:transcriptional repressor NrdR
VQCPYCAHESTRVLESRKADTGLVQRKRQCSGCGQRFSTVERINVEYLSVVKRDGRIERFQREKIARGIGKAASVFNIPAADVNAFIDRILDQLQPASPGLPIKTSDIGELVLRQLQDASSVTDVARIRFAMVFLGRKSRLGGFKSAEDLREWLRQNYPNLREAEIPAQPTLVIKKHAFMVEPFEVLKLERSIGIAAKGRGADQQVRSDAMRIAKATVEQLAGQTIVTSAQIASTTLKFLRAYDDISYLRYAATTKPFRSVEDFWNETLALMQHPEPTD